MQSSYDERFEREMGCTEAEWLRWLPDAMGENHWKLQTQSAGVDEAAKKVNASATLSYADELYALRNNIALVRQKLG